jgi:hypothetical protein
VPIPEYIDPSRYLYKNEHRVEQIRKVEEQTQKEMSDLQE